MATKTSDSPTRSARRGLGRGLAALIPESDFDMLSDVARWLYCALANSGAGRRSAGAARNFAAVSQICGFPRASHAQRQQGAHPDLGQGALSGALTDRVQSFPAAPSVERSRIRRFGGVVARAWRVATDFGASPTRQQKKKQEKYQLIAGERRWRAAERAQLAQIPAIVRDVDDKSALELAIIENVQRHDISAVESAHAYRRLASEFALSQEKIAARVGKSRASIANTMRLLDLPDVALDALRNGEITEGHGRALLTASNEGARRAILRRVVRDHLSVRETERLAREGEVTAQSNVRLPRADAADITRLEDTLQRALGLKLQLKVRKRGGQIVINYSSPEELQRLATRLSSTKE